MPHNERAGAGEKRIFSTPDGERAMDNLRDAFFATSLNYMDRRVIALLKPTLEHTIGLTEINYGYIVDAFQVACAIGLLVAGRLIDRIGTRLGYILIMAVWSFHLDLSHLGLPLILLY